MYNEILNDLYKFKNYYIPFLLAGLIGLIYILPQNIISFFLFCFILIILTINNPKSVLYISVGIITFRYFFVNSSIMDYTGLQPSNIFFRYRELSDYFVANLHNFVFVYLTIVISKNIKNINNHFNLHKYFFQLIIGLFFIITISALINASQIQLSLLLFIQIVRPVLFFLLILVIEWTPKTIYKFVIFILIILFPIQFILTYIDNIQYLFQGFIFLGDNFTGSFTFPFNWVTTQLIFFELIIIITLYFYTKSIKALIFLFLILFSIISVQTGFQSAYNIILFIPYFLFLNSNYKIIELNIFKNFLIFTVIILGSFAIYIMFRNFIDLPGYEYIFGYSDYMIDILGKTGLNEYPKFLFYSFFIDMLFKGDINIIIGIGAGNFLSGAGVGTSKYFNLFISNLMYFKGFMSNTGYLIQNSFLGILGEIGIFGTIIVYSFYILPYYYIKRNLIFLKNTIFMPIGVSIIGIFYLIIGMSFMWNIFEDFAMPVYYFCLTAVILKYIMIKKNEVLNSNN